jgi:hypothetical protein
MSHDWRPTEVLSQFGNLAKFRSTLLFGSGSRLVVDIQHDLAANKAQTSHDDLFVLFGQFESNCFAHSGRP